MDVDEPVDNSIDDCNAKDSVVDSEKFVVNQTVNQMNQNSQRKPMNSKIPSLTIANPSGSEDKEEQK